LIEMLERSRRVLISSHLAPDHDSVASSLLLKRILENHYPDTNPEVVFERPWSNRHSSVGMDLSEIFAGDEVDFNEFDLLIMVDVAQLDRTFDVYLDEVNELESIAIDHHNLGGDISCDLLIHDDATSAAEVVYSTFKEIHGDDLEVTPEMARYVQLGILLDTHRFMWNNSPEAYRIMADMNEIESINVEDVWNHAAKISRNSIYLFNHILKNAKFEEDMVYTFVDDDNVTELENFSQRDMNHAATLFINDISRTIEDVNWSFIVKGSTKSDTLWRVSFRSVSGTEDVLPYAEELGGGGYHSAASGTVQADSPEEATVRVWEAINKVRSKNN
jgi:nanoRNase/pAp phosphatase (c-di-AMP/oligoRNAs hydrolase)